MSGVVDGAVDDRVISISAKVSDRICARLASKAAAEISSPTPCRVRYVPSRSPIAIRPTVMRNGTIPPRPSIATVKSGSLSDLRDLSFQPAPADLRLKQAENGNEEKEHGSERDAEPAKDLSRILHQKACPRLM